MNIEVIDSYIYEDVDENDYPHPELYYLARSIDYMGMVDAVYFCKYWRKARGCRIERAAAEEYGVKILEYDFIDQA